jgi:hypothetical protein
MRLGAEDVARDALFQLRVDTRAGCAQGQSMEPGQRNRTPGFDDLDAPVLAHTLELVMQAEDHVGGGGFRVETWVPGVGFAGDERRRAQHTEGRAEGVEEFAGRGGIDVDAAHAAEAVE